jgi:hypothetical protein
LAFDTVFTGFGTSTRRVILHNPNPNALVIESISFLKGTHFRVNVDGEADATRWKNLTIRGGDSAYIFVRAYIDPLGQDNPLIVTDELLFHYNGNETSLWLSAIGQDVTLLSKNDYSTAQHLTAKKPYLITDTLIFRGDLTIDAGATLYMRNNAAIFAVGNVTAEGTLAEPIIIRGYRTDNLFDSVPYLYAAGGWNGFYLQSDQPQTYDIHYLEVLSGNVGMSCVSTCTGTLPTLRMDGCKIHNHTLYGLVLEHVDALVTNTEISNCGLYCVYCNGGKQDFVHSTVASYFGYTNIRIQSAKKENTAAVYIDNLSKTGEPTVTSFYNSVITGYLSNQLVLATPIEQYYEGVFSHNYLKTDTLLASSAKDNTYWQETDTAVFRNTFYKYKEYIYYDFRPDSLSPLRGIGDSIVALPYPMDREGFSREFIRPDAGCYQYHP